MATVRSSMRLADRYVLGDVVGTGGGSTVHHGLDELLNRPVAVKLIPAAAVETADPAGRQRFLNEARSMAKFQHPHMVQVFDAGEQNGSLFLVMQFVDGTTLAHVIADQAPIPTDRAVAIFDQVLGALAAVHAAGFVHRDVKPANVLIDRANHVYLTDFGIAKQMDELEQSLTVMGTVMGTPRYLSPEQAAGEPLGATSDVYAAGMLLAELIGVRNPDGSVATETRPDDPLTSVVERATRRDPAERYRSASEMAAALRIAGQTATAVIPDPSVVVPASLPVTATQAMPVIGAGADDATSIMGAALLVDPVLSSSALRPGTDPRPWSRRTRRRWPLLALLSALGLLLMIAFVTSRDDPLDVPATPSTLLVPSSTLPVPVSIAPAVVPEVTVVPPPEEPAPTDAGNGGGKDGGGGEGSQGNGRGKPDKAEKP